MSVDGKTIDEFELIGCHLFLKCGGQIVGDVDLCNARAISCGQTVDKEFQLVDVGTGTTYDFDESAGMNPSGLTLAAVQAMLGACGCGVAEPGEPVPDPELLVIIGLLEALCEKILAGNMTSVEILAALESLCEKMDAANVSLEAICTKLDGLAVELAAILAALVALCDKVEATNVLLSTIVECLEEIKTQLQSICDKLDAANLTLTSIDESLEHVAATDCDGNPIEGQTGVPVVVQGPKSCGTVETVCMLQPQPEFEIDPNTVADCDIGDALPGDPYNYTFSPQGPADGKWCIPCATDNGDGSFTLTTTVSGTDENPLIDWSNGCAVANGEASSNGTQTIKGHFVLDSVCYPLDFDICSGGDNPQTITGHMKPVFVDKKHGPGLIATYSDCNTGEPVDVTGWLPCNDAKGFNSDGLASGDECETCGANETTDPIECAIVDCPDPCRNGSTYIFGRPPAGDPWEWGPYSADNLVDFEAALTAAGYTVNQIGEKHQICPPFGAFGENPDEQLTNSVGTSTPTVETNIDPDFVPNDTCAVQTTSKDINPLNQLISECCIAPSIDEADRWCASGTPSVAEGASLLYGGNEIATGPLTIEEIAEKLNEVDPNWVIDANGKLCSDHKPSTLGTRSCKCSGRICQCYALAWAFLFYQGEDPECRKVLNTNGCLDEAILDAINDIEFNAPGQSCDVPSYTKECPEEPCPPPSIEVFCEGDPETKYVEIGYVSDACGTSGTFEAEGYFASPQVLTPFTKTTAPQVCADAVVKDQKCLIDECGKRWSCVTTVTPVGSSVVESETCVEYIAPECPAEEAKAVKALAVSRKAVKSLTAVKSIKLSVAAINTTLTQTADPVTFELPSPVGQTCDCPCPTPERLPDRQIIIADGCDDADGDPANEVTGITRETTVVDGVVTTAFFTDYGTAAQAVYPVVGSFIDCVTKIPIPDEVIKPECEDWEIITAYQPEGTNGVNVERWNVNAITGLPTTTTVPSDVFVGPTDYSGMPAHDNGAPDGPIVVESDLLVLDQVNDQSQMRGWTYLYTTETIRVRESHGRAEAVDYFLGECCGEVVKAATGVYPNTSAIAFDVSLQPGIHFVGFEVFDATAYSAVRYQYSDDNGVTWKNIPAAWLYTEKPSIQACPVKYCPETNIMADALTGEALGAETTLCPPTLCGPIAKPGLQCAYETFYRVNKPDTGTVEQQWTTSVGTLTGVSGVSDYLEAFSGTDAEGYPSHPNAADSTTSSNTASTTNITTATSAQDAAQSDFYIWLDEDTELREFNSTAEAAGVWISECGTESMTEVVNAPYTNTGPNPIGQYKKGCYRVRLYHSDFSANGIARLQGFVNGSWSSIPAYPTKPTVDVIKGWACDDGRFYNLDKTEPLEDVICEDPRCGPSSNCLTC